MTNKISMITISYNSIRTIEKTFMSILNQTYRPLEYVIIDGKSTDGTVNLIEKYIPILKSKGIEVAFSSESDCGISDAFNKGIIKSTGDLIGIINSDDSLIDDILCDVLSNFDDSIDVLYGDCQWIDSANQLSYTRKSRTNLHMLKYEMIIMHPSCFIKKAAYDKYGMYDINLKYVMDKDLLARFYSLGAKFKYVPVIFSRMSSGGISDANYKQVYNEGLIVAKRNNVPDVFMRLRLCLMLFFRFIQKYLKRNRGAWMWIKHKR